MQLECEGCTRLFDDTELVPVGERLLCHECENKPPDWVDSHSVTCAGCGCLTDEREAIKITEGELCPKCGQNPESPVSLSVQ